MKKTVIALTFSIFTTLSFGQKFMVKNSDTLPYQETMEVRENGDTVYLGACQTFEKVNGQVINLSDDHCLRQGLWKLTDSIGNFWTGSYRDNNRLGLWSQYDKDGKLLKQIEEVSFGRDTYTVKETDYTSGQPVILVDKPFLAFYIKNLVTIMAIFFMAFFTRPFINSSIYNRENGTNIPLLHFRLPFTEKYRQYASHSLKCVFTLWFFNYKAGNRLLVIISNALSALALSIFFGAIMTCFLQV